MKTTASSSFCPTRSDTWPKAARAPVLSHLLAGALVLAGAATPASAEDFYKGKTLTLIIGTPAGGGNDVFGRPFIQYFAQHLPGSPNYIVQNMVGASGVTAANHLYNVAPKDGSVISIITSSTLFLPLFGNRQVKFDPTRLSWVGNGDEITGTCGVWHTTGIAQFDDLKEKRVPFGSTGVGGVSVQHATAFNNLLGTKIDLIKGYPGTNEVNLAMQRGEVGGACALSLASLKDRWWEDWQSGRLKPIIQTGIKKHPDLPGVAHIYDYAKTEEDKQIFDLIFGRHQLGRPISGPPSVPADRLAALRAAFEATMKDKRFLDDMKRLRVDVTSSSGADVEQIINRFFAIPAATVDKAAKAMGE